MLSRYKWLLITYSLQKIKFRMGGGVKKSKGLFKRKLIADGIFLFFSAITSFLVVFLFDIHRSFYEWPIILKFIFKTPYPYVLFIPLGTIIGFVLIKLLLFGFEEQERT